MASLSDVRTRVRLRLEESAAAAWTDNEIDECITATLEEYSTSWPLETTTTAAVSAGAVTCTRPATAIAVVRVVQADGSIIPRRGRPEGRTSDERLAFEEFGSSILFSVGLAAQTLTIWYTAARAITDVVAPDIGLIVAGAVWRCLQQRGVQTLKRRSGPDGAEWVREARREYEEMFANRRRRMRVSMMQRWEG